jgi:hypothetical protein
LDGRHTALSHCDFSTYQLDVIPIANFSAEERNRRMRKGMTSRKIKAGKRAQVPVEKLYLARSHDPSASLRMYTCIDLFMH